MPALAKITDFQLKNRIRVPQIVKKDWGHEIIFANNEDYYYCGKILHINAGHSFSMHAHRDKCETFYVLKGKVILKLIDAQHHDATVHEHTLLEGSCFEIEPMQPHQLTAVEESDIIEASTFHRDEDSYRYWR